MSSQHESATEPVLEIDTALPVRRGTGPTVIGLATEIESAGAGLVVRLFRAIVAFLKRLLR